MTGRKSPQRLDRRLLIAAMGILAFGTGARPASAADQIKIGVVHSQGGASAFVADAKGYFKAEGLDAKLILFDSAAPIAVPTTWFGLFEWPHLPFLADLPRAQKQIVEDPLAATHATLAFSMALLVVVHIAAALKHHFKDRDDVLKHILP